MNEDLPFPDESDALLPLLISFIFLGVETKLPVHPFLLMMLPATVPSPMKPQETACPPFQNPFRVSPA